MISEEFYYHDVKDYLNKAITTMIVGTPTDQRSQFFYNHHLEKKSGVLIRIDHDAQKDSVIINITDYISNEHRTYTGQPSTIIPYAFNLYRHHFETVMYDISSLSHQMTMFITKLLVTKYKPRRLFSSYVEPNSYLRQNRDGKYDLTEEILGIKPIPGFARRQRNKEKLLVFLGFEGSRLSNIIDNLNNITEVVPIIGSPSYNPRWFVESLWNNINSIKKSRDDSYIKKCSADSVFDAYKIIDEEMQLCDKESCVLAPFGSRAHSLACALYASHNKSTRLIYDNPIEINPRSTGIKLIKVYHLTQFITV